MATRKIYRDSKGRRYTIGTKGQRLYLTPSPASSKNHYADDEEDHKLHSHLVGMDYHKKGRGGIGNMGLLEKAALALKQVRKFRSEASKKNAPKTAHGDYSTRSTRFQDGYVEPHERGKGPRQNNFNLENGEDLAQGSQTQWAQPTSISSLISGQLRQASNAPLDYADQIAARNAGATKLAQTNPMGAFGTSTVMYGDEEMEEASEIPANIQSMFLKQSTTKVTSNGVTYVRGPNGGAMLAPVGTAPSTGTAYKEAEGKAAPDPNAFGGWQMSGVVNMFANKADQDAYYIGDPTAKAYNDSLGAAWNKAIADGISPTQANADKIINTPMRARYAQWYNQQHPDQPNYMDPKTGFGFIPNPDYGKPPAGTPDPNAPTTGQSPITPMTQRDEPTMPGTPQSGAYNPWAYGKGGEQNAYGPSAAELASATQDALSLANAYFAPQRTELAYELGDMETDMRRLAVNLGRQTDDPVLQAKLYKEGMRAVRTLDAQQNTFAFQMVDARRKEENQNFQFYDSLAQQEYQLWQANNQFKDSWNLEANKFNLNNWIAMENARNAGTGAGGSTTPESMEYAPAASVAASTKPASGIYAKTRY